MAALATQTDVESDDVLGRALTSAEAAKVSSALEKASDYVRTETGRKFAAGTYTVTRYARDGKVRLDSPTAVTAVNIIDSLGVATLVDSTTYTLRGSVLYGLPYAAQYEITYTTDGTAPDELVRVVAAMAAREITNEIPANATSYSWNKGPFGGSASFDSPTDSVLPTPSEERIIRRFAARRSGSVSVV